MEQEYRRKAVPEPLLAAWIKWTMDFWDAMAQMGPGLLWAADAVVPQETGNMALKLWQAFFSLLSEPATIEAVYQGIRPPSEVILRMAQEGWRGYFHLYQQWLRGGGEEGAPEAATELENLGQDIFKICNDIYESDFRQLMRIPQAGVMGCPPEQVARAKDRLNQFQAAMAEFIYLLYLPLKKSLRAMPAHLEDGREERAAEDFKEYYKKWLRILEGHYMTLFQSPEFTRTLSHTLETLEDFTQAKEDLLGGVLGALPVPNWEMDELYQELYLLKKEIKELTKKVARLDPPGRAET